MKQEQIQDRLSLLKEISPWPFYHNEGYRVHSKSDEADPRNAPIMFEYKYNDDCKIKDVNFMVTSMQFEHDLIQAYQELESKVKQLQDELDYYHSKDKGARTGSLKSYELMLKVLKIYSDKENWCEFGDEGFYSLYRHEKYPWTLAEQALSKTEEIK
jgi:hypothetical protein